MSGRWSLILVIAATLAAGYGVTSPISAQGTADRFETIRGHIQAWLSEPGTEQGHISSSWLKEVILDDWANQGKRYQILSVRKPEDYSGAGHVPHAINVYWRDILKDENLARLDPAKTQIIYCYYGHASMITYTLLGLLGHKPLNLDFGMMGWNVEALVKEPWDQKANYEVEMVANRPEAVYPLPVITSQQQDARGIIKERAIQYLAEASPVIESSEVKALIDDWDHKKADYQILSVRSTESHERGHVPHAINIPWARIAELGNLKQLDPSRTIIVYSDNGQTGQSAATILSLLGYKAVNMMFGMADWNRASVDKSMLWDGVAAYPVEPPRSPKR
jgi:rhodanese-related sulfurtransferase